MNPSMFNAFKTLGLDINFDLNLQDLEQAYLNAMKIHHPDQQISKSIQEASLILEQASLVNQAYRLLKDPYTRAQHCLQLQDVSFKGERSTSQDILIESMTLRESLEEADNLDTINLLFKEVKNKKDDILQDLSHAFKNFDLLKASHLTEHFGYLNKFHHEVQEKIWALEETNIAMENNYASSAA